jgi:hypothetical protein
MIYCFGNSHASIFSGAPPCGNLVPKANQFKDGVGDACRPNPNYPYLQTVYLGGALSYNFTTKYLPNVYHWIKRLGAQKDRDALLFCVGEIDCRWHLPKKSDLQNIKSEDVVKECIDRFFESFKILKSEGWNVIVCGTQPTTVLPGLGIEDIDDKRYNGEPRWGDCDFRNNICLTWNTYMEKLCNENSVGFISIYDKLVDENNITRQEYFKDYCHIIYDKCFPMFIDELKRIGAI